MSDTSNKYDHLFESEAAAAKPSRTTSEPRSLSWLYTLTQLAIPCLIFVYPHPIMLVLIPLAMMTAHIQYCLIRAIFQILDELRARRL